MEKYIIKPLKRTIRRIKKVIRYVPVIWNSYDFDYIYAITLFKMQLEDMADFMESDRAVTDLAKDNAKKIRKAICLMDKVYEEEYAFGDFKALDEIYGDIPFKFVEVGPDQFLLEKDYPWYFRKEDKERYKKDRSEALKAGIVKHKKAHKILWKYIEHNIQNWWD